MPLQKFRPVQSTDQLKKDFANGIAEVGTFLPLSQFAADSSSSVAVGGNDFISSHNNNSTSSLFINSKNIQAKKMKKSRILWPQHGKVFGFGYSGKKKMNNN